MGLLINNGMNIIGQGSKIMLFALPSVIAAIALHLYTPQSVHIPVSSVVLTICGVVFLLFGIALWLPAVIQLLSGFPKGKLITTGAYGVCRNPLYTSVALFIVPGIAFLTSSWIYLIISVFIISGIHCFIGKEEARLLEVFGDEYKAYLGSVNRIIPFIKPGKTK